ncbi:MAG: DUF192 domain-containing protein [Patescibacteria group bacterium]
MSDRKSWIALSLLCLVVMTLIWLPEILSLISRETSSVPTVEFANGTTITIVIADTQAERVQGLSGHAPLTEDEGMLFIHDDKQIQGYWMKDMLFPIDIIWIDGDTIVGFQEDAPLENPVRTIYYSPVPVDQVLEVSAGFVGQNDVKVGDVLDVVLPDT